MSEATFPQHREIERLATGRKWFEGADVEIAARAGIEIADGEHVQDVTRRISVKQASALITEFRKVRPAPDKLVGEALAACEAEGWTEDAASLALLADLADVPAPAAGQDAEAWLRSLTHDQVQDVAWKAS